MNGIPNFSAGFTHYPINKKLFDTKFYMALHRKQLS